MKRTRVLGLWAVVLSAGLVAGCTQHPNNTETQGPMRPRGTTDFATRTGSQGNTNAGGGGLDRGSETGAPADNQTGGGDTQPREVEESDIYKVVGNHMFVLNRYRGLQILDISNLDAPTLVGKAPIYGYPRDMYVRDSKAYVIVSDYYSYWRDDLAAEDAAVAPFYGSQLRIIDISNLQSPQVVGGINLEGDCSDSRIVGDVLYTVSQRYPWYGPWGQTSDGEDKTTVVSISIADDQNVHLVDSKDFPRQGWSHHLNVSSDTIFLASSGYDYDANGWDYTARTVVRYVDISDPAGQIVVRGQVQVPGYVNDRWSLDPYQGVLRVASGTSWGNGDIFLTTVDVSNPDAMTQMGQYTLHISERLTAARFDGPRGYLVSYRNVDPLYAFDLSNPASPVLMGELHMSGWLDFIVPQGDRLVALGHEDTSASGQRDISLAVSLVDVSDGHEPLLLDRETVGENWGWVPSDRDDFAKVFRVLPQQGLVLFPFQSWSRADYRYVGGVQLLDLARDSLTLRGLIQNAGWVERGIPHGDNTVMTLSSEVFQIMDIADRDHPALRGRLELARNVQDFAVLGEGNSVQLSGDWWRGDTQISVVPLADPDSPSPTSSLHVPAPYGRMFRNGGLVYVSSVQDVDDGDGNAHRAARVQVVDLSDPANPRERGSVTLPEEVYASYGYWYWGWGDQVVQVRDNMLAFFRFRYNYWGWEDDGTGAQPQSHTLYLVDLSNPDNPVLASTTEVSGSEWAWGLQARGNTLYLSEYQSFRGDDDYWYARYYLRRVDVSNPYQPQVMDRVNIPGMYVGAKEDDQTIYTQENWWDDHENRYRTVVHALVVYQGLAYLQSSVELPGYVYNLLLNNDAAFSTTTEYGYRDVAGEQQWYSQSFLVALDLSDTQNIALASQLEVPAPWGWMVGVDAGRAFVSAGPGIFAFNVSDIHNVAEERFFRTQGWGHQVSVNGDKAFVTSGYHGVQVLNLANTQ